MVVAVASGTVTSPSGRAIPFELDAFTRRRLLEGLDDIALTLASTDEIAAFEAAREDSISTLAL